MRPPASALGSPFLALVVAVLSANVVSAATSVRISHTPLVGDEVQSIHPLSDGSVVYRMGQGFGAPNDFWRASLFMSTPTLLTGSTRRARSVLFSGEITPDDQSVFIGLSFGDPGYFAEEVYMASLVGGEPTVFLPRQPTAPFGPPADKVYAVGYTPDRSEVLYLSDHEQPGVYDLYAKSLSTLAARRISPPRPTNSSLYPGYVRLSPDGTRAVYAAEYSGASFKEVYSVPLAGGSAQLLNAGLHDVNHLDPQPFDATGEHLLFSSNYISGATNTSGVYRTPLSGGTPTLLSDLAWTSSMLVSASGSRVAYRQGDDLFGVASAGGAVIPYATGSGDNYFTELFFTPDDARLIYQDVGATPQRIFSVPAGGGASTDLTVGHDAASRYQSVTEVSPNDESRIVYQSWFAYPVDKPSELYSVRPDGTGEVRLNMPLGPTGAVSVNRFRVTPDGDFVIFGVVEQPLHPFYDAALYITPAEGGPLVRLTPELPAGAAVREFALSPDGTRLFYSTDGNSPLVINEAYATGIPMARVAAGAEAAGSLNGGSQFAGGVDYELSQVTAGGLITTEYSALEAAPFATSGVVKFHQWDLDFSGTMSGGGEFTLHYADAWTPGWSLAAPQVYGRTNSSDWTLVAGAIVDEQSGSVSLQFDALAGMTIGVLVTPPLAGDFNEDGSVDVADLIAWRSGPIAAVPISHVHGDANGDGLVDGADFLIWQRQLGMSRPVPSSAPNSVPEPATALLAMAAIAALTRLPRRQTA